VSQRLRADLALLLVTLAWGTSFVVVKDALAAATPHWIVSLRHWIAVAALLLLFRGRVLPRRGLWLGGLAVGALLYLGFALQTVGLAATTPARSAFLTATYVAMVPLLDRVLFGRPLGRQVVVAVLAVLVGMALLLQPERTLAVGRGEALTLACAFAFAAHILALNHFAPRLPALPLALLQLATAAVLATPVALWLEPKGVPGTAGFWGAVLYLGVVCSAGAFAVQTWAQRHSSPARVALIISLESPFAAGVSAWRGEALGGLEWLGGGLVVVGVALGQLPERPRRA
jgi:drug/metabolite transporter (DMT)-like permease